MEEASTTSSVSVPVKEKKPRSEAQIKAFERAREKMMESRKAKQFSRDAEVQQEKTAVEAKRAGLEAEVKEVHPDVSVKVMEKRKPKPKPEPKLEVVIPAHVEKSIAEPAPPATPVAKPRKPRAPRAPKEPEAPVAPAPAPAPPQYTNPYTAQLMARMRR